MLSQLSSGHTSGTLIDVLVIGYLDPKAQSKTPIELTRNNLQRIGFSVQEGSRQAALNGRVEIQPTPIHKPAREPSGIHQNTESLTFQDLGRLFRNPKANSAEKLLAFHRLREILLHQVPRLKEKLNSKLGYVGYRAESSDRAYIYIQPDVLVLDVRRPRTIESELKKAGIEILYRHNFQGQKGWTTGIRLRHDAPKHQIELVAHEIILALSE